MHGENLKMGKDVRGIERGECACGECEDFVRSDGATCGYCGCLPTRLPKKDARYSSEYVDGTSGAEPSESVSPSSLSDESSPETEKFRKHYRRKNMDESGHGSKETIMLVGKDSFLI